ncbi:hypothetical protein [Streptomyces sp. NBC_01285]|uniref:hypothetical protein n=1 Tax=Streptomyces sp. NBC_01285 TaxID=2903813 RepID=UPI0022557729|nr:hypothetical protein [Streptomyces sp. NBC_01285]MCX4768260.1 hypothetical protein [Streptomyces sp. NBC_01285]
MRDPKVLPASRGHIGRSIVRRDDRIDRHTARGTRSALDSDALEPRPARPPGRQAHSFTAPPVSAFAVRAF